MQDGDYIDAKTVLQMTEQEFNNFRSYLKFLGYRVNRRWGQYEVARTHINIHGNAYIKLCKEDVFCWSTDLENPNEQITLEEALRMSNLGEMMAQQE